jgi:diketogulonate reductase-like aldo/keto reductase
VLRRAAELGVDHIDTADFYRSPDGTVRANDLIRQALFPYPPGLVIATKVGPVFGPHGPTQGTADGIRPAVEANLEALGVDRLDLVYLRIGWRAAPGRVAERAVRGPGRAARGGAHPNLFLLQDLQDVSRTGQLPEGDREALQAVAGT